MRGCLVVTIHQPEPDFAGFEGGENMSRKIQGMTLLQVSDVIEYWMAWVQRRINKKAIYRLGARMVFLINNGKNLE